MKDRDNNSGRRSIDERETRVDNSFPGCAESEDRFSLARSTAADLERVRFQPDARCQADGVDFTLTIDEYRMVELILAGFTDEDMARQFCLSESAIHRRTVRLFGKLGVSNKFELVLFAISRRIVGGAQHEHLD